MGFQENLKPFIDSLEQCISTKNWYGALIIAVTLPGICVSVDGTQESEMQKRDKKTAVNILYFNFSNTLTGII